MTTPAENVARCPRCHDVIEPNTPITICPACKKWHHEACWAAGNGCAVADCPSASHAAEHLTQTTDRPAPVRRHWGRFAVIGILVLLIIAAVVAPRIQLAGGRTLLHDAAESGNVGLANLLLACGADPEARDQQGMTPVLVAIDARRVPMVQCLATKGVNLKQTQQDGATLLHVAAERDHAAMIDYLVSVGIDVNQADSHGNTPLHRACQQINAQTVAALLQHGAVSSLRNGEGRDAIHILALATPATVNETSSIPIITRALAKNGGDLNTIDRDGFTALLLAYLKNKGNVQGLIAGGADVNAKLGGNLTALHAAAIEGDVDFATMLLEHKANVNAQDNLKRTPLYMAAKKGHQKMAELLVQHGADLYLADASGKYPCDMAIESGNNDLAIYLTPGD